MCSAHAPRQLCLQRLPLVLLMLRAPVWHLRGAAWGHNDVTQADHFPVLRVLNVSHNELSGPLPGEWGMGTGQSGASGMSALDVLEARLNLLTGTLPAQWPGQNLTLTMINLDGNQLSGVVMPFMCGLAARMVHKTWLYQNGRKGPCRLVPGHSACARSAADITCLRESEDLALVLPYNHLNADISLPQMS